VVAQYTFDPYGSVVSAEHLLAHSGAHLSIGHKGLFTDRLDIGVVAFNADTGAYEDAPQLVPYARLLYHARNRTLDPQLGRWLQRDPNATGQLVLDTAVMHGAAMLPSPQPFDLGRHFEDGLSAHAYLASRPIGARDPLGLFGFLDVLPGSTSAAGLAGDWNQQAASFGMDLKALALLTLIEGSSSSIMDVAWATDWNLADNDYNASGWDRYFGMQEVAAGTGGGGDEHATAGLIHKIHHMMTIRNKVAAPRWTDQFTALLAGKGLNAKQIMESSINAVEITADMRKYHKGGPHAKKYHEWVYNNVRDALGALPTGATPAQAAAAVRGEVNRLYGILKREPWRLRGLKGPLP